MTLLTEVMDRPLDPGTPRPPHAAQTGRSRREDQGPGSSWPCSASCWAS
ncbi:hypothetical protein NKG05_28025 [Oerskovia sp. M15]